jgi:hypothetical protein
MTLTARYQKRFDEINFEKYLISQRAHDDPVDYFNFFFCLTLKKKKIN